MLMSREITAPYLGPEHTAFRDFARASLGKLVIPYADRWEAAGRVPREAWEHLADLGLLGLPHNGSEFLRSAIFLDELGNTGYAGIRASIALHSYMATAYLEGFGTAEQRSRFLAPARNGSLIFALAISESSSGSDLRTVNTRAVPEGDGYRVTGEKHYVVNGSQADLIVTLVHNGSQPDTRMLRGCSFAVIDAHADGISRSPQPMAGWRSADIAKIEFRDVAIGADCLLGAPGQALRQITQAMDFERLVAGLSAVGGVRHCLDRLCHGISERLVGGAPLSRNPAIQHRVADLQSEFETVRQYAYHVAWLHSEGRLDRFASATVKLRATELEMAAAESFVQFQGARGYLAESDAARIHRDAIGATIGGGASELLRRMIFELA